MMSPLFLAQKITGEYDDLSEKIEVKNDYIPRIHCNFAP
jgi:hypothetical protein